MATPVRSVKNQYRGINPHLHSYWQSEGGWDEFHTSHIVHLMTALKTQLRPLGYTAAIEQSLQIRRLDVPAGKPKSDVTLYDQDPLRPFQPVIVQPSNVPLADTHQLVMTLPEILSDEEEPVEYRAISIYQIAPGASSHGEPVAWIELLSPSNKPEGQDALYYRHKRLKLLESGIVFIELDYLHETPPTFSRIPNYRPKGKQQLTEPGSHPYRILVIDPRPVFSEGQVRIHQFDVDEPIPTVTIPLNAGDALEFDFDAPYQKTFEEVYWGDEVNYRQLPLNFEHYSEADQSRIVARMLTVLAAEDDLEKGPFPIHFNALPLAEALAQLETWQ